MKSELKQQAISLRRRGLSYSEILKEIPVAKSTLSLWLRSVGLSKRQKQRLTKKKLDSMRRGWIKIHEIRINRTHEIKESSKKEVLKFIHDPLWLTGVIMYWAEGSKEKTWRTGERISFTNMDVAMLKLFYKWITTYFKININTIEHSLYLHKGADINRAKKFWIKNLIINQGKFKVYLKPHNVKPMRKNVNESYNGVLRIRVAHSTDLNRKIAGWIEGVVNYFK